MKKLIYATAVFWIANVACVYGLPPIITTVAGSGRQLLGLGGPATQVNLGDLGGLASDSAGNLYVSDQSYNGVIKITPGGVATLVAGNGVQGFSGDNGPATQASLNGPGSLVFDAADNLYISDENNNRVRQVTPGGTITTFAGGGPDANQPPAEGILATNTFVSPTGLAIDSAGNVYVSDANHKIVRKIRSDSTVITVIGNGVQGFSGDGGPATAAAINSPTGLAVDSAGNLYMADAGVARIRKVTTDGIIHTIAGTGQAGLNGDGGPAVDATIDQPRDLFVDSDGNLYIAISANNVIRKISVSDGIINTVVGTGAYGFSGDGGPAVNATLKQAVSVVIDGTHNIYVSDHLNNRVRKVDSLGAINTIAGNGAGNSFGDGGPAVSAGLNQPLTPAFDGSGNMYIADTNNNRVRKVTPDGTISTIAGNGISGFSGDGGPAVDASLSEPEGVAVDTAGNVYVADFRNARVRRIDLNGIITTYAGNGQHGCCGFAAIGDGGQAVDAVLGEGMGSIALDGQGNLFIADGQNYRIRKVDTNGIITTVAGNGQNASNGDGGSATSASLSCWGVAVDGNGNIYISEENYHHIRKVNSGGIISTVAGDGTPGSDDEFPPGTLATSVGSENPGAVAVDADGSFYFTGSGQVRKVATDGTISRVVKSRNGDQHGGFAGDGGPAIDGLMNLNRPGAVAMDAAGDIYIADTGNNRIRKVTINPPVFGNISTRLAVGTGDNVLIGGFIINGTEPKKVIVRAIGPSLTQYGVAGALADPVLDLHDSSGQTIATNNNWKSDQQAEIQASGLAPSNDLESAIIMTLDPGAYTAIVHGVNDTTGVALVESYDLAKTANSKLANISTRGLVQTGDNVMIGGLIVQGNNPTRMIVRAIGPTLTQYGVTGALADPTLELHNSNGSLITSNDNWRENQESEIQATGLAPSNDAESAIVATLSPGAYTAIVIGKNSTSGVALIEAFQLNN